MTKDMGPKQEALNEKLIALSRIYVPPHTRMTESGVVNVDGYWRDSDFDSLSDAEKEAVEKNTPKKITGQAMSKVLKSLNVPISTWSASGRVKGWGHRNRGVGVEQRERFDPNAGGGIRTSKGWKRDYQGNMVKRGAWKKDTGIFDVQWYDYENAKEPDPRGPEYLQEVIAAFKEKGWHVTEDKPVMEGGTPRYTVQATPPDPEKD